MRAMSLNGTSLSNWARFEVVRSTPDFGPRGPERPLLTSFSPPNWIAAHADSLTDIREGFDLWTEADGLTASAAKLPTLQGIG